MQFGEIIKQQNNHCLKKGIYVSHQIVLEAKQIFDN